MSLAELTQRKKRVIKWILYSLLLFVAYVFQTTVDLFRIFGVKPILILPVVLCIAMFEGEWAGAIFGVTGGLFWDMAADKLLGFNALILLVLTVLTALLFMYLIKINIWNALIVILAAALLQGLLDFVFCYLIWNYENSHLILIHKILPTAGYTTLVSPLIFWICRKIYWKFFEE